MGIERRKIKERLEHRGTSIVPVNWTIVTDTEGNRSVTGIVYNAALKKPRRRITCSDEVWESDSQDVFYSDESVLLSVDQLTEMDLEGTPLRVQHDEDLPPVGEILANWVDGNGDLHILGEVPNDSKYNQAVINLIDSDICSDLSISYPLERDPYTKEVTHLKVDEVSFVNQGHFPGCKVRIKASKRQNHKPGRISTVFRTVKAKSATGSLPTGKKMATPTKKLAETKAAPPQQKEVAKKKVVAPPAAAVAEDDDIEEEENDELTSLPVTPEDLVKAFTKTAKEKREIKKSKEEYKKRAEHAESRLEAIEEAKKKEDEEYAKTHFVEAEEVTDFLADVLEEETGAKVTQEWLDFNKGVLSTNDALAHDTQAVQVACSRKIKAAKQRIDDLEAETLRLQQTIKMGVTLANVVDEEDESERHDRRNLKAAARNSKKTPMVPDQEATVSPPGWAIRLMGGNKNFVNDRYVLPTQRRDVNAGKAPARKATPQKPRARVQKQEVEQMDIDDDQEEEEPITKTKRNVNAAHQRLQRQQTQPTRFQATPFKEGYPVNEQSLRNNPDGESFWGFMKKVLPETSLDGANRHMGGVDFGEDDNGPSRRRRN